jgi:hypothetical protein
MPGIIRCPESTAIQAGNPDHRGRGEEPGVSACSAGPGVRIPGRRGQRSHSVVVVPLSVPSARLEPRLWWLRTDACRRVGIRCAGRRPAVWRPGGDRGTNASGVAPGCPPSWRCRAGSRWPPPGLRGAWLRDGSPGAGSRLRPGLVAGRGSLPVAAGVAGGQRCLATWTGHCRAAGEAHLTVSGSAVTPPDEGSRATAPGRAVCWILAGRYRLCLTTSC